MKELPLFKFLPCDIELCGVAGVKCRGEGYGLVSWGQRGINLRFCHSIGWLCVGTGTTQAETEFWFTP